MEKIELVPVREQHYEVMQNLSRLYTYDLSDIAACLNGYQCDAKGQYSDCVDEYLEDSNFDCYLFKVKDEWAGFAIIKKKIQLEGSDIESPVSEMAEFFLARKFRRKGVATDTVFRIFDSYPGKWEVDVWPENRAACSFWNSAISKYRGDNVSLTRAHNPNYDCEMISYTFG